MKQDDQTDQDTSLFIANRKGLMYYNSAIWNFLCSAWILKGLNLDVNNFTSCPPRLIINIKILTVKKLLMLIKINIKKFQSKHPTHWGLSNVRGLCRAISLSAASTSKGKTSSTYWDNPFSKVQTRYLLLCLLRCLERRTSEELYSPYKSEKQLPKSPQSV